jgi:hypothetical protein
MDDRFPILTPEHEAKLRADAPRFFATRDDARTPFSERGFEIGDGWFGIVHKMAVAIEATMTDDPNTHVRCVQIKEKFSTLRVYTSAAGPQVLVTINIINAATSLSSTTCEWCGADGGCRDLGGWSKVLCEEHAAKAMRR